MKTCGFCNAQYNDSEPKCPVCGATLLKYSSGSDAAAEEYARIKKEIEQNRRTRSKIIAICAAVLMLAIIITISSVVGHITDPQRDIDAEAKGMYESAMQNVKNGNFDSALTTLDAIDPSWSDYNKTEKIRMEAVRGILLERAEKYMANGDYESLLKLINSNVENINADAEIKKIYETSANQYRNIVIAEAQDAYRSNGYEAALTAVNFGLSVLPNDSLLLSEKENYAACAPVDLTSLTPYYEGLIEVFTDGVTATTGNTYSTGLYGISNHDYFEYDCFHIWDIGANYNKLTATCVVDKSVKGSKGTGIVRIYGDNILLYEKDNVNSAMKPCDIEVDITGVTDLKIELLGDTTYGYFMRTTLADIMLYKDR